MAAIADIARLHCLLATCGAVDASRAFSWLPAPVGVMLPGMGSRLQLPEYAS